jgi:glycosyltransferase involved in cell wall biosynthesis
MPAPPDVALIAPYPPRGERHGGHSGVASYTANLAHALTAHGLEVAVVAPFLDGEPQRSHDGDVDVQRRFPLGRRALPAALSAAAATGAAIVHLQFELFLYGGTASLLGLPAALGRARWRLGESSLVTTMHQVVDPTEVTRSYTRLHRVGVPAPIAGAGIAAVQTAITRASAATVVHEDAFRRVVPTATVIPHGIETVVPLDRDVARKRLGRDRPFTALCFGFVAPYKGIETLLAAAHHTDADVDVVVAGGEHPRLGGRRGFAAELAARHRGAATFTGWVPDQDVTAWFSAADVAVFPYPRPFSSSGALALALAHGTPALLSPPLARCAGAPSAMSVPLDPTLLAQRLDALATSPATIAELRLWSAVLAAGRSWPNVAEHHARLYESIRPRSIPHVARRRRSVEHNGKGPAAPPIPVLAGSP